jgi:sulfate permease, SulP family
MGVLINLASHPVINGFTNAAALIIGLSLLNSFINVPMPRSDMFLRDLWHVVMQFHLAHWPTIAFGLGTLAVMSLLKKWLPRLPGVLVVVVLGTVLSAAVDFEKTARGRPAQIVDAEARAAFEKYAELESALADNKQAQGEVRKQLPRWPKPTPTTTPGSGRTAPAGRRTEPEETTLRAARRGVTATRWSRSG